MVRVRGQRDWLAWTLVFSVAAVLWSFAVTRGMDVPPAAALPFGIAMMGRRP